MDSSSLVSVIVQMSLEMINSSASNHLEIKLLQFHVQSHIVLLVDFGVGLVLLVLVGIEDQGTGSTVSLSRLSVSEDAASKYPTVEGLELSSASVTKVDGHEFAGRLT